MSRPAPSVRRTRRIAVAVAAGLVTGLGTLTAPSHADDSTTPDIHARALAAQSSQSISASAVLKSTKGKRLHVSLSAGSGSDGGFLNVGLVDRAGESHSWLFKTPTKALKLNNKGKGSLTAKYKPYGNLRLTIKPVKSWKLKKCQGKLISKSRPLKVTGLFKFDSRSAWGKLGGKRVTFKGARLVKRTGLDGSACSGGGDGDGDGDATCPPASISWSAFQGSSFMSSSWSPGATKTGLVASRSAKLAKPRGALRVDFRTATVPVPTTSIGASATLAVKSQSPTTGSATLSSATGYTDVRECAGGLSYEQSLWYGVSYQNGAAPLTMKMTAYGAIRLPNSATAIIQSQTKAS